MNRRRTPWWMDVIILVLMSPALVFPGLINNMPAEGTPQALVWLYPLYVIVTGVCTWMVYPQRPALAWILLALLVLSNIAMYILVNTPMS